MRESNCKNTQVIWTRKCSKYEQINKEIRNGNNKTSNKTSEIAYIVRNVVPNCEICKKIKKPIPWPIVVLPRAAEINQTVPK